MHDPFSSRQMMSYFLRLRVFKTNPFAPWSLEVPGSPIFSCLLMQPSIDTYLSIMVPGLSVSDEQI